MKNNLTEAIAVIKKRSGITESFQQPSIDGKYKTKQAIVNAMLTKLRNDKVESRYRDEAWAGVVAWVRSLESMGVDVTLNSANYEGHGDSGNGLPTRKVYIYDTMVKDAHGREVVVPWKVQGIFVGQTGTMEDDVYELTYYPMN